MTRLCVAIFVNDLATARRDIALAAEAGADLVELRIDTLEDESALDQLLSEQLVPMIVTCRPTWEGGQSELEDIDRGMKLVLAAENGARFIDVELKTVQTNRELVEQLVAERPAELAKLIVSSHDFAGRPARLTNLVHELNESPADIAKIVWTARSIRDNLEAFEILQHQQKPTIALCMGEAGLLSRVLAKKFGGFLTFASLGESTGTAAGQVSIGDMKRLYRWDAINPATKVYGVVGSPIMHSMSPAIHNAAFEQVGHDGIYLPMRVEGGWESFKAFMESFLAFAPLDLCGLSITIPHKEHALVYLKEKGAEIERLAEKIGALNTVVIEREGQAIKLRGFNTDYAAILDSITTALEIQRQDLRGKRVAIIGAGGTGRTAVAALAACGATVVVYNRTREKADSLAAEFNGQTGKVVAADMSKLCDSCCEIYINTTSVGMFPNVDETPWGERPPKFEGPVLVFDTVYNPIDTKFLGQAKAAGAKTISGVEMFVRQAGAQFSAWTGKTPPLDLMRSVVTERLFPSPSGRGPG